MEEISYERIKELFKKHGYLPNEDLIWRTYIGFMQTLGGRGVGQDVYAFCLDGPAGTGKSSFAIAYSKVLEEITGEKIELIKYTCNDKTGKEETFEDVNLVAAITKDADKLIIPGFIAKAIKACNEGKRVILRLDEYDKAKPVEDSFLLEFLQEATIYTSQSGELKLKDPSKLQVILCKNDNRSQLSFPLIRRLNFIELEDTTPSDLAEIVGMKLKSQDPTLKMLVVMMYSNLYAHKDDYTRIPSVSEVMIAIDEADILTKGGAPKQYVYKSIVKNLLKTKYDIQTFLSGNQKNNKLDEDLEQLKSIFDNDPSSSFDKQSLLLDLYNMYFKPIAEEYRDQLKNSLDDICEETNEFISSTDYKLIPIEVGKSHSSKFELSDNWFLLGQVDATERDADNLVRMSDDKKWDGPIFIVDDDYIITVVKEDIGLGKVSLKFLSNKAAIPTSVVIRLKGLIQNMNAEKFEFDFPLVSQFKVNNLSKQKGFYEYSTDYRSCPIEDAFDDIMEVRLNFVKLGTGRIIEGKGIPIQNFGKGEKALINSGGTKIQYDLIKGNKVIDLINSFFTINLKKPIVVSLGKREVVDFDPETFISKIRVKSKKKGSTIINSFEPDIIVTYLNSENSKEAENLNEILLKGHENRKKGNIYKALDESQKEFLSNFVDSEVNPLNINEAISNCVDYALENDILNPNTLFTRPRNIYDCLSPDPKIYSMRLKQLEKYNNNK